MACRDLGLCDNGAPEHIDIFGSEVSIADLFEAFTLCPVRRRFRLIDVISNDLTEQPTPNTMSTATSLSTFKPSPYLPPELWIAIFTDATAPVTITPHRRRGFPPELEVLLRRRLYNVTRTLVLVCRMWRAIALPLLYETVQIRSPDMARHFLRTLVESASADPQAGYGLCVRNLVLPSLKKSETWEGFHIIHVLECCPHLETLWKPYYSEYHDPPFWHGFSCPHSCTGCPPQPCTEPRTSEQSYRWNPSRQTLVQKKSRVPDVRHALGLMTTLRHIYWKVSYLVDIEAKPFSKLFSYTPNLISLSMTSSERLYHSVSTYIYPTIRLTSLTKVEYSRNTKQPMLLRNHTPNLTHIVTTARALEDISLTSVLNLFYRQLRVIELVDEWNWWPFYDRMAFILRHCPQVDTLKYNVSTTMKLSPSQIDIVLHKSLRNIVLRIGPWKQDDKDLPEELVARHFDILTGVAFPELCQVVLEGVVGRDAPFRQWYRIMCRRFPVQRIDGKDIIWEC